MEKWMGRLRNLLMVLAAAVVLSICAGGVTAEASDWDEYVPENAVEYNGHYYYLYDVSSVSSYEAAETYCAARGGYLATITSSGENEFLYEYITEKGYSSAYFGLSDEDHDGTWVWSTGEKVSYLNWASGEPNDEGGIETYGMFYYKYDGTWNDGSGRNIAAFICEWSEPFSISSASVKLSRTTYTYNGTSRKPTVTVTKNGKTLTKGTDYKVTYSNNKNAGTATVKIKGIGIYTGTVKKTFTIKRKSISSATVSLSTTKYTYSGKTRKPSVEYVKITLNGSKKKLTKGTDYTVSYSSGRTSIGKYKVKIKGTGNYTGTITKTFKIIPKQVTLKTVKSSSSKKLTVKWSKVSGSVTKYQIRYKKKGASDWSYESVDASDLKVTLTGLKSGKNYYVQVRAGKTVNGTTYYGKWSEKEIVTVK